MHVIVSLVPRPPPFLPSICVHNNTREQKTGKKTGMAWEHSSREWMRDGCRGEGPIFKYIRSKLESEFLTGPDK